MTFLMAFVSGAFFGLGLIVAGMNDPLKVLAFLDVTGNWDPSLALVMVGAIGTAALGLAWAGKRRVTLLGEVLQLPGRRDIDSALVAGSALFGIGWGLSGFCPGPAVVGLLAGYLPAAVFVIAMFFGMEAHAWYSEARRPTDNEEETADG